MLIGLVVETQHFLALPRDIEWDLTAKICLLRQKDDEFQLNPGDNSKNFDWKQPSVRRLDASKVV